MAPHPETGGVILLQQWTEPDAEGRPHTIRKYDFGSQAEQAAFLRQLADHYAELQSIRHKAVSIVFDEYQCQPKQQAAHALAIGDWVQRHIRYVNEGPETFSTPIRTLKNGFEDCDGHATLVAALCQSIGIPTELVLVYWRGGYRHIFPRAVVKAGGRLVRVPLDTTLTAPIGALTNPIRLAVRKHGPGVRLLVV